ncbi:hypothetical protein EYF80_044982 [Liparis tanakae]|uniref:Uncharacterized protein n=1 Tax=Liparis tanakae TaxID=230148 RepID=A0A4Z2FVK1_9TELE|nr:hypothetical protein EYF80_044982 [Liparis tanakae]
MFHPGSIHSDNKPPTAARRSLGTNTAQHPASRRQLLSKLSHLLHYFAKELSNLSCVSCAEIPGLRCPVVPPTSHAHACGQVLFTRVGVVTPVGSVSSLIRHGASTMCVCGAPRGAEDSVLTALDVHGAGGVVLSQRVLHHTRIIPRILQLCSVDLDPGVLPAGDNTRWAESGEETQQVATWATERPTTGRPLRKHVMLLWSRPEGNELRTTRKNGANLVAVFEPRGKHGAEQPITVSTEPPM